MLSSTFELVFYFVEFLVSSSLKSSVSRLSNDIGPENLVTLMSVISTSEPVPKSILLMLVLNLTVGSLVSEAVEVLYFLGFLANVVLALNLLDVFCDLLASRVVQ